MERLVFSNSQPITDCILLTCRSAHLVFLLAVLPLTIFRTGQKVPISAIRHRLRPTEVASVCWFQARPSLQRPIRYNGTVTRTPNRVADFMDFFN